MQGYKNGNNSTKTRSWEDHHDDSLLLVLLLVVRDEEQRNKVVEEVNPENTHTDYHLGSERHSCITQRELEATSWDFACPPICRWGRKSSIPKRTSLCRVGQAFRCCSKLEFVVSRSMGDKLYMGEAMVPGFFCGC